MKLSPDFNRVLEEIRNGAENALYGAVPAASEELFQRHVESLIEDAGLPSLQVIHKWARYGFDPELLQQLLCDCHCRFLMLGYAAPKTTTSIGKPQRKRRKPRTYEQALKQRKVRFSPGRTVEQQSADYEVALAHNREISARVRELLKEKGIPGREFIRYNAFAYRVDRYCRNFSGPSLDRAVSGILDEFESKGRARDVLAAIVLTLFGIPGLS